MVIILTVLNTMVLSSITKPSLEYPATLLGYCSIELFALVLSGMCREATKKAIIGCGEVTFITNLVPFRMLPTFRVYLFTHRMDEPHHINELWFCNA